jgi:hypothetical protein
MKTIEDILKEDKEGWPAQYGVGTFEKFVVECEAGNEKYLSIHRLILNLHNSPYEEPFDTEYVRGYMDAVVEVMFCTIPLGPDWADSAVNAKNLFDDVMKHLYVEERRNEE